MSKARRKAAYRRRRAERVEKKRQALLTILRLQGLQGFYLAAADLGVSQRQAELWHQQESLDAATRSLLPLVGAFVKVGASLAAWSTQFRDTINALYPK